MTAVLTLFQCGVLYALEPAFVGSYRLIERNGQALPAPFTIQINGSKCTHKTLSSKLTIGGNGSWSEKIRAQVLCRVVGAFSPEPVVGEDHGQVVMDKGRRPRIVFSSSELQKGRATQSATLVGNKLFAVYRESDGKITQFVFERISASKSEQNN